VVNNPSLTGQWHERIFNLAGEGRPLGTKSTP
jgi:hypothetical protein